MRTVRDLLLAAALTAVAYRVVLEYRLDYLGHFAAGFGATVIFLAVVIAVFDRPRWTVLAVVAAAIVAGFGTEATVFRFAIFDPVDFANQSLGACIAGAGIVGRRRSLVAATGLVVLGLVGVMAGFHYAFA